jgi:hypothetical protein
MDQSTGLTRAQKIEALRTALAAYPEHLARFNDLHPPPTHGPVSLEDALINMHQSSVSDMDTISPTGHWYGLRHKFNLTCAKEARLSHVMHLLL